MGEFLQIRERDVLLDILDQNQAGGLSVFGRIGHTRGDCLVRMREVLLLSLDK